jgi:hypothetical protein
LRRLETALPLEWVQEYVAQLGNGLRDKPGDWKITERVMTNTTIKALPIAQKPKEMSWITAEAKSEQRHLYKQQSGLRRKVRSNNKIDDQLRRRVNTERKKVQRSIKKCIMRHKDKFRLSLSNMVVKGESNTEAQAAISALVKGYDLG